MNEIMHFHSYHFYLNHATLWEQDWVERQTRNSMIQAALAMESEPGLKGGPPSGLGLG
jgi:hypothetical protein